MLLNPKQKLFVKYYRILQNATQAALKAGYSKKTAHVQGCVLLKHPKIKQQIALTTRRQLEKADLTAEMVLAEIRRLAFSDLSKAFDEDGSMLHPQDMPKDLRAALQSVETEEIRRGHGRASRKVGQTRKIKLADKVRSLEMLARHFKLLTDVHEHSGKDGAPQVVFFMPANGSEAPVEPLPPPKPDEDGNPAED